MSIYMQVCPLCNGLEEIHAACPHCFAAMTDAGRQEDYTGPYAPYQDRTAPMLTAEADADVPSVCIHRLECPQCGTAAQYSVAEQVLPEA